MNHIIISDYSDTGVSDAKPLADYLKKIGVRIFTISIGTVFTTLGELGSDTQFEFGIIDPSNAQQASTLAENIRQLLGFFFQIVIDMHNVFFSFNQWHLHMITTTFDCQHKLANRSPFFVCLNCNLDIREKVDTVDSFVT